MARTLRRLCRGSTTPARRQATKLNRADITSANGSITMIGFVKKSAILAAILLSATFAYAGDLRPAPAGQGGDNMHPAPQGSKETGMGHASENGGASVS